MDPLMLAAVPIGGAVLILAVAVWLSCRGGGR
jgi:hypothetical protein